MTSASYEVGYRKPPRHTQFQKGQSGNPGGRPRRSLAGRLEELALYEAYRTTVVMEDGHAMPMPAIQAVLRRQLESAAGGNVRAQRDILAMIRDIERARSVAAPFEDGGADDVVIDDDDVDDTDDVVDTDDADANDGDGNGRPSIPPRLRGGQGGGARREVCRGKDPTPALPEDGEGEESTDTAGADHHDAGGTDNDEPGRQQADGIDTYGERRQAEREPVSLVARVERSETREHLSMRHRRPRVSLALNPGYSEAHRPRRPQSVPRSRKTPRPRRPGGRLRYRPARKAGNGEAFCPAATARTERGRPACTAATRMAPRRSGGQPRQNSGRAFRRLAASPGRTKSGPGPAQAAGRHARAPATPAERDEKLKTRC